MKSHTISYSHTPSRVGFLVSRIFWPGLLCALLVASLSAHGATLTFQLDVGGRIKLESIDYAPTGYPYTNNTAYTIQTGRILELRVQADPGYVVDKWYYNEEEASYAAGTTFDAITLNEDKVVRVSFKPITNAARVTLQPSAGGELRLESINYVKTGYPWTEGTYYWVKAGDIVELRAQAKPGYFVGKWAYNGNQAAYPPGTDFDAITVNQDVAVSVSFEPNATTSTLTFQLDVGGKIKLESIDYAPTGYPYTNNTAYTIETGRILELRVQADTGYVVDKWYYNGEQASYPAGTTFDAITLNENKIVRVSFKPIANAAKVTLQPSAGGELRLESINYVKTGYPWTDGTYYWVKAGDIVELRAQAKPGYVVGKWAYNGNQAAYPPGTDFDAITVNRDVVASVSFEPKTTTSTLTFQLDVGGSIKLESIDYAPTGYPYTNNTAYSIETGRILGLRVQADPGYVVDKWYYNGEQASFPAGTTFDAITLNENKIVRVSFKPTLLIATAVELRFATELNRRYQLQKTQDLQNWINDGPVITGTGSTYSVFRSTLEAAGLSYRLVILSN